MNIHHHYDQLNEEARDAVDSSFGAMVTDLRLRGFISLAFNDPAEHVVDAISKWLIESGYGQ